jgi:4-hydroxybenzoate polyprenyltransferase
VLAAFVYFGAAAAVSRRGRLVGHAGRLCARRLRRGLTYAARQESLDRVGNLWPLVLLAAPMVLALPALREGRVGDRDPARAARMERVRVYLLAKRRCRARCRARSAR